MREEGRKIRDQSFGEEGVERGGMGSRNKGQCPTSKSWAIRRDEEQKKGRSKQAP